MSAASRVCDVGSISSETLVSRCAPCLVSGLLDRSHGSHGSDQILMFSPDPTLQMYPSLMISRPLRILLTSPCIAHSSHGHSRPNVTVRVVFCLQHFGAQRFWSLGLGVVAMLAELTWQD